MDNINKVNKNKSIGKTKVLKNIENFKTENRKIRYKTGDSIVYEELKYKVYDNHDLGNKGIFYELIPSNPVVPITKDNIKSHIYAVDQVYVIQDELHCRLGEKVEINEGCHNSYDIHSEVLLGADNKNEYYKNLDYIKSLEIKDRDYSLGFSYDISGYEYWKEHNFENDIKVVLNIHDHGYDINNLSKDIRDTVDKLEKINYPYESKKYKVENGLIDN